MSMICLRGGRVYDPASGIDGEIKDLWIQDGRIVGSPGEDSTVTQVIDLQGDIVMPGGVDMHCHIAGPKINTARAFRPSPHVVPTAMATGQLFAGMGYTTAIDAAVSGLYARQVHEEFRDMPYLDRGFLTLIGNHHYVLEEIRNGNQVAVENFCGWLMGAVHSVGMKIVNPGGVENWKQICRASTESIDHPMEHFGVTPRQILTSLTRAADRLSLPHPLHIHCNNLGIPGNFETTLQTMRAIGDARAHFAHIQFHSYGGDANDGRSFRSAVPELVEYVKQHRNISIDVGHVTPGEAMSVTGDAPFAAHLARLTNQRWYRSDCELESSCGVIPGEFQPFRNLIHAVQWAIALEWYLLMDDPWRMALTSDHPNGGAFVKYPEVIALLLDRNQREDMLDEMPEEVKARTNLADISRQYTLGEIAIITRAAPAKLLGLTTKGHLAPGADADITVYRQHPDWTETFQRPRYVYKAGRLIVEDGELMPVLAEARTLSTCPEFDEGDTPRIQQWVKENYSVGWDSYRIAREEFEPLAM